MFISQCDDRERAQRLVGSIGMVERQREVILNLPSWLSELFIQAAIDVQQQRRIVFRACLYAVVSMSLILLHQALAGIGLFIFSTVIEYLIIQRKAYTRSVQFERDYPTFLLSLASSVRTGLDSLQAIASVAEMYPITSELRKELSKLCEQLESGTSEEEAFLKFGSSIAHPDIRLFSAALILSRKQGSSLGNCLQRLTKVTRQRQSFRRKSRAAVAMQRMSAFGIAGCSVLIGGMQAGMNPKNFIDSWHHPLGFKLIASGITLLSLGLIWMLRLGRTRI